MTPFAPISVASVALAVLGVAGFVVALFAASWLVPGPEQSIVTRNGERIRYRFNGLALFAITMGLAGLVQAFGPGFAGLARHIWSLFIAANLLAWPAAIALALRAPAPGFAAFFYGAECNPQLFGIDLKMFSYRPSLIGLALINVAFAALQWDATGALSLAMIGYQAFTLLYVLNYFHFEHGMLFTWDIIEEKFGWMLVWGDYVLVPFFYSMPAAFVLLRPDDISPLAFFILTVLYGLDSGYSAAPTDRNIGLSNTLQRRSGAIAASGRRPAPGVRILGHRAQAQLYRRVSDVSQLDGDGRLPVCRALSGPGLAAAAADAARRARRSALP